MKAVVLNNELPALSRNNIIYQFNRVGVRGESESEAVDGGGYGCSTI